MKAKVGIALLSVLCPVLRATHLLGQNPQKTVTATLPAKTLHWTTMTGNDLYPKCLAWERTEADGGQGDPDTVIKSQTCYSFVLGVINAYPASASFPLGTTNEQIVDVATKYMKDHPADRGKDAWALVLKSEEDAFHVKWLLF